MSIPCILFWALVPRLLFFVFIHLPREDDKLWQVMTSYDKLWQIMTSFDKLWQAMTSSCVANEWMFWLPASAPTSELTTLTVSLIAGHSDTAQSSPDTHTVRTWPGQLSHWGHWHTSDQASSTLRTLTVSRPAPYWGHWHHSDQDSSHTEDTYITVSRPAPHWGHLHHSDIMFSSPHPGLRLGLPTSPFTDPALPHHRSLPGNFTYLVP